MTAVTHQLICMIEHHPSYLRVSDSILRQLPDELEDYTMTNIALHFPADGRLPKAVGRN
jgi:hypothetical protein